MADVPHGPNMPHRTNPNDPKYMKPEDAYDLSNLTDKVLLFTGPTSGLGMAAMEQLTMTSCKPAKVILVGRSATKLADTSRNLESAGIKTSTYLADVEKPKDVIECCKKIVAEEPVIHIAALNAGAWLVDNPRVFQEDGLEKMYCTNFLQMCLFIDYLSPVLAKSSTDTARARVAVMGSFTSFSMAKGNLAFEHLKKDGPNKLGQGGGYPYSQTKLAQHVYCKHMAPLLAEQRIDLNVACPGAAPSNTPGWTNIKKAIPNCMWGFFRSIMGARYLNEGAAPILHLCGAATMEGKSGKFADFGYKHRYHRLTHPDDLEFYPSEGKGKVAPTTSNPVLCAKLHEDTKAVMEEFKAKYA